MTGRRYADDGSSLVDILLAVAIMGVAMATVVGAMMTASQGADVSRRTAEAQLLTRSYAEAVAADPYADCATTYAATGFTLPAGYSRTTTVTFWNTTTGAFGTACTAPDTGLQRVTVTIATADARASDTLSFTKRYKPTGETP